MSNASGLTTDQSIPRVDKRGSLPAKAVAALVLLALVGCWERPKPDVSTVAQVAICAARFCRVFTDDGRRVTVIGPVADGDTIYTYKNWNYWVVKE